MEHIIFMLEGGLVWSGLCFLGGYYLAHRGIVGVKSDLTDVKTDVSNLKATVSGTTSAPTV